MQELRTRKRKTFQKINISLIMGKHKDAHREWNGLLDPNLHAHVKKVVLSRGRSPTNSKVKIPIEESIPKPPQLKVEKKRELF